MKAQPLFRMLLPMAITCSIMLQGCSGSPPSDVAGGSGAGNPNGLAALSIVIDTTPNVLYKTVTADLAGVMGDSGRQNMGFADSSGLMFTAETALIIVKAIHFLVDSGQNPAQLVQASGLQLQADSTGIIVEGPFIFDAFTGACAPGTDSLRLPEARYSGIQLDFQNEQHGLASGQAGNIHITGLFVYQNDTNSFVFNLSENQAAAYFFDIDPVTVSRTKPASMTLALHSGQWAGGIDIKTCLDNGYISLMGDGSLVIDSTSGRGPCQPVEASIRRNIILSGSLRKEM